MRNRSKSAVYVAATGTLALLLATSAFAEERHRDETWRHNRQQNGETRTWNRDDGNRNRTEVQQNQTPPQTQNETQREFRGNEQRNNQRSYEQGNAQRSYDRNDRRGDSRDHRGYDNNRSYNNNRDYRGGSVSTHRESYRNGIPRSDGRVTMQGRISRYERDRGGYRVWVGGSAYPYWVPESYFRSRRIGIGLDLRLGGIFRNGAVYVDVLGWPGDPYYNDPYYNDGYYGSSYVGSYDNGYVRGIVDGVDYRTQLVYVRDDYSGRLVTVDMRRVDRRYSRLDIGDLRRGDRVSLNGEWIRGGLFAADRIDSVGAY